MDNTVKIDIIQQHQTLGKVYKILLLIAVLCSCVLNVFAKEQADLPPINQRKDILSTTEQDCESAKRLFPDAARFFRKGDYKRAESYIIRILQEDDLEGSCPISYYKSIYLLAAIYLYSGKLHTSNIYINDAILKLKKLLPNKYLQQKDINELKASFDMLEGEYALDIKDFENAMKHNEEARKKIVLLIKSSSSTDPKLNHKQAACISNIGFATIRYLEQKDSINHEDLHKCIEYFKEAKRLIDSLPKEYTASPDNNISVKAGKKYILLYGAYTYIKAFDFKRQNIFLDKAQLYINEASDIKVENGELKRPEVIRRHFQAELFLSQKKKKEALKQIDSILTEDILTFYPTYSEDIFYLYLDAIEGLPIPKDLLDIYRYYAPKLYNARKELAKEVKERQIELTELEEHLKLLRFFMLFLIFLIIGIIISSIVGFNKEEEELQKKNQELELQNTELKNQKNILEENNGTLTEQNLWLQQKSNLLSLVHDITTSIGGATNEGHKIDEKRKIDEFIEKEVNSAYEIAKQHFGNVDGFYVALKVDDANVLNYYIKETDENAIIQKRDVSLSKVHFDTALLNKTLKGNQKHILINDFEKEYKDYLDEKPILLTKGKRGTSILTVLLPDNKGVISIQSHTKNAFLKTNNNDDYEDSLGTIGQNFMLGLKMVKVNLDLFKEKKLVNYLKGELSHRIKNQIAALAVTIEEQIERLPDRDSVSVENELREVWSRVNAITVVHDLLDQKGGEDKDSLSLQDYLYKLVDVLFIKSLGYSEVQIKTDFSLSQLGEFYFDMVGEIGLVITELGLNTFEHAYKGMPIASHHVELTVFVEENEQLEKMLIIHFADRGKGMSNKVFEKSERFGFDLIKTIIIDRYEGEVYVDESLTEGTNFIIKLPI